MKYEPCRKVVRYGHLLLRHDSWIHFCIPFTVPNGVEHFHFLALSLSIHAAFHFGIFGLVDYVLERRVSGSECDSGQ